MDGYRDAFDGLEHRRAQRTHVVLPIEVTVALSAPSAETRAVGQTRDISPDGLYFHTSQPCALTAGETIRVDVQVPQAARREVPFSRMAGLCRVLRVDSGGAAVYFYPDRFTMIGTSDT